MYGLLRKKFSLMHKLATRCLTVMCTVQDMALELVFPKCDGKQPLLDAGNFPNKGKMLMLTGIMPYLTSGHTNLTAQV